VDGNKNAEFNTSNRVKKNFVIYPYFGLLKGAKRRSRHIERRDLSSDFSEQDARPAKAKGEILSGTKIHLPYYVPHIRNFEGLEKRGEN